MPIPKTRKGIALNDKELDKALKTVKAIPDTPTTKAMKKEQPKAKSGRPSAIPNRTDRINLCLSQEVFKSFTLAFPQEQLKRKEQGEMIDKSSLIEEALKEWLEKRGYLSGFRKNT